MGRELAEVPVWAIAVADDPYASEFSRNVTCKVCGRVQASSFLACIDCCTHKELDLDDDWDDGIVGQCISCGKNFDFSGRFLADNYKAIRIQE